MSSEWEGHAWGWGEGWDGIPIGSPPTGTGGSRGYRIFLPHRSGEWVGKGAGPGPYLGLRKGRQNPYDLGRGFLHPPFFGGSGARRSPGKVHSGC